MNWHVGDDRLAAYLDDRLDDASASSVEAHLAACGHCRDALAYSTPPALVATSWVGVERRVDADPDHAVDRFLIRSGVPDHHVRILAPTLPLRLSWLTAVAVSLVTAALLVPDSPRGLSIGTLVFLTLAALAPVAGIAAALGSASEPAPEVAAAAPVTRWRLLGIRATTVLVVSIAIGLLAGLFLPGPWTRTGLWLFPSLALCAATTVLSGRFGPGRAAIGIALLWCGGVAIWVAHAGDRLAPFRPGPQLLYLTAAAGLVALLALRPELLEPHRRATAHSPPGARHE